MSGFVVRGGTVVDGTGAPGVRADVRVRDGVIAEVGRGLAPTASSELDAGGAVVTPGFIDNHTHFDPSLFWDPFVRPDAAARRDHGAHWQLLAVAGADARRAAAGLSVVFCYIEDIPSAAFLEDVPWGWESYAEYRDAARTRRARRPRRVPRRPHPAAHVRDGRRGMGARRPPPSERAQMAALLDDAMRGRRLRVVDVVLRRGRRQPAGADPPRRRRRARRAVRRAGRPRRVRRVHPEPLSPRPRTRSSTSPRSPALAGSPAPGTR